MSKERSSDDAFTKGIGGKLLRAMGWTEGMGLGANGQGIKEPIEAQRRVGRQGIGTTGRPTSSPPRRTQPQATERRTPAADIPRDSPVAVTLRSDLRQEDDDEQEWDDQISAANRGMRIEITRERRQFGAEDPRVIARRRREAEVYAAESAARSAAAAESAAAASAERKKLADDVQNVLAILPRSTSDLSVHEQGFAGLLERFGETKYFEHVAATAATHVLPVLRARLAAWQPLGFDHEDIVKLFARWRPLLTGRGVERPGSCGGVSDYDHLIEDDWLMRVQREVTREWDPCAVGGSVCLAMLDAWCDVVSPRVLQRVLDSIVLPRLSRAVETWRPPKKSADGEKSAELAPMETDVCGGAPTVVPIEEWLHPWLPFVGAALRPLFVPLRQKLAASLAERDIRDPVVHETMTVWGRVLDAASMETLLRRVVLPQLEMALAQTALVPDLETQDWSALALLREWADVVPGKVLGALLDSQIFPRWMSAVDQMLAHGVEAVPQVAQWCRAWQRELPREALETDGVRRTFLRAREALQTAQSGGVFPPTAVESAPVPAHVSEAPASGASLRAEHGRLPFRAVLEQWAESHGLLMMPAPRRHEGHQVFAVGRVMVYLDSVEELVYMRKQGIWKLVSLDELVSLA